MKVSFTTLGCKVNQYETSAMERMLADRGHEICIAGEKVDAVIINTCAVTSESGRKSRQAVRKAKRDNPDAVVAVCGCFSQVSPEEVRDLGADMVCGSGQRNKFINDFERVVLGKDSIQSIDNPFKRRKFEMLSGGGLSGRTRAYLKIQDGCDNFCSFCIIPFARGAVRSMPEQNAVDEARKLADEGYKEIVITGIEIASYGKDLKDGSNLINLIERISQVPAEMRIRLGSIEPRLITVEFCQRVSEMKKLCNHFHLSLQSGCDATLRRMRRKYDTERFYESVSLLRQYFPECAITSDLIVGFPGENEDEYNQSMDFIKKCKFSDMHIFPYSIRKGTKAADMELQLDKRTKTYRAKIAGEIAKDMKKEYLVRCVGRELEVLAEGEADGGHAGNFCMVRFAGAKRGQLQRVKIIGVSDEILLGDVSYSG